MIFLYLITLLGKVTVWIEAGAAPDLGIGSIGDIEDDLIASFEVLVNNPDLNDDFNYTRYR